MRVGLVGRIIRIVIVLSLASLLGGCFHVELSGPVSGATAVITELRTDARVPGEFTTLDEAGVIALFSQESWDEESDLWRLVLMGNFFADKDLFMKDRLYLVTVSGGRDEDADADGALDEEGTPVAGSWHAIMSGANLRKTGFVVSPITEALYQSVKADIAVLDDAGIMARLNKNTRVILTDVNRDEQVNYFDALGWTEFVHIGNYKLDFSAPQKLSDAITAGANENEISALSRAVLGEEPEVDALQFFTDNVSMPVVQRRCIICHQPGGTAPNREARLVLFTNSDPNHLVKNHTAFIHLGNALGSLDLSDYVTGRASGQTLHGGGKQLSPGSRVLLDFESYLNMIE
jgi:hypothetical protein